MVTLKVDGTVIKQKGSYQAVADSVNYFVLDFVFSEEWLACDSIVVSTTSRADENLSYNQMLEGNSYRVPGSMMRHPGFTLGLVGYDVDGNVKITTQSYEIAVKKTGFNKDAAEPGAEQMSAFDQVMDELGKMKKAFKYVHIKWADMEPTSNAGVDMVDTPAEWMGIYCGNEEKEAPTDCMKYKWYKVKGEKGDRGDAFTYDDFTPEQLATLVGDKADVDLSNVQADGLTFGYKHACEVLDGYLPTKGLNLHSPHKEGTDYSSYGNIVSRDSIAAGWDNLIWNNGKYVKVNNTHWDTDNHLYTFKFENFSDVIGANKTPQIGAYVVVTQDMSYPLYVMPIIAYDESTGLVTCSYNPELYIWYAASNNPHVYIEKPDTVPSSKDLALGNYNTLLSYNLMLIGDRNLGVTSNSLMVGKANKLYSGKSRVASTNNLLVGENHEFNCVLRNSLIAGYGHCNFPEEGVSQQSLSRVFLFGEGLTPYSDQFIIGSWNDPDETKAFIIANEANIFAVDRQGGVVAKGNIEAASLGIGSTDKIITSRGIDLQHISSRQNLISENTIANGSNNFIHPASDIFYGTPSYDAATRTINFTSVDTSYWVTNSPNDVKVNDIVYLYWQNVNIYQKPIKATISAWDKEARTMSVLLSEEDAKTFNSGWMSYMSCIYVYQNFADFECPVPCLVIGKDNLLGQNMNTIVLGENNSIIGTISADNSILAGRLNEIYNANVKNIGILGENIVYQNANAYSSLVVGYSHTLGPSDNSSSASFGYNMVGGTRHTLEKAVSRSATWGNNNKISGSNSFAFGNGLIANTGQFVIGKNNIENTSNVFVIGGGTNTITRMNILTVDGSGNVNIPAGRITVGENPVANMDVATKEYVDETVACNVSKAGDTMEGPLIAHSDMNYGTSKVRNIGLTTGVPTSIPNGEIVGVYIA